MNGMNALTGKSLSGLDHLRQSVRDILTTPLGSRIKRRTYGSRLYQLVDAPASQETLLQIYAATAEAILRWEPRFQLSQVTSTTNTNGQVALTLTGNYLPEGRTVTLDGIVVN